MKKQMLERIPETPHGIRKRIQFIYGEIEKRITDIKDKREIRVLDIGCGTGELITIPLGYLRVSVLGIDIHLPSIEYAERKNPFENVRFECISVDELAEQHFDFIVCSEILEHLEAPLEMLKLIKEMLKRDGICIITIPNGYGPKELEKRLYKVLYRLCSKLKLIDPLKSLKNKLKRRKGTQVWGSTLKDSLNPECPHIQFFSLRRFKSLLHECGLSIMKMENRRFLSGPFSDIILLASKILINKTLINWNVKVASKLPYFLTSSWMFVVKHQEA